MDKRFILGFTGGLLIFIVINLLAAHLASDCGLPAIFGWDSCADDITRAGWPFQFYEQGGFIFHFEFNSLFLLLNLWIGTVFAIVCGWLLSRHKLPLSK